MRWPLLPVAQHATRPVSEDLIFTKVSVGVSATPSEVLTTAVIILTVVAIRLNGTLSVTSKVSKWMSERVKVWVSDIHPYQCAIRSLRPVRHAIPIPHCAFEWLVGPVADVGATATTTLTACKDPKEYALHMVFGTPTAAPVVIILLHSEGVS